MRVGTRITATTSVIVAVALVGYAFFTLRSEHAAREQSVIDEARDLAVNIQTAIQGIGVTEVLARPEELTREFARSTSGWNVAVLDAALVAEPPGPGGELQHDRLKKLIDLHLRELSAETDERYSMMMPLSVQAPNALDVVVGAVEVSRSTQHLDQLWRDDLLRAALTIAIIMAVLIAIIVLTTRLVVGGPIDKLIAGIDDVAQGDLSRVLLSEHDDEIGALATRFNEMTFSLRESRAETDRQNQAKLSLEQRLSATARLATMGQMAAEIAHEVGTPLNVISGRARNLGRKADDREAVVKNADIIAEQAGRIARIIQRLLDFTRRKVGTIEPEELNLNEITLSTMEFLDGQLAVAKVRHSVAGAQELPPIIGNRDQLQQVFLNLFLNAMQAMPEGGDLQVETSKVDRKRPGLEADPSRTYVLVSVADTGVGIPEEAREKIFEPFYTSKEGEGGTGLGLAVCHGIIKEHDGWIEIRDGVGGGTVFDIYLPAA